MEVRNSVADVCREVSRCEDLSTSYRSILHNTIGYDFNTIYGLLSSNGILVTRRDVERYIVDNGIKCYDDHVVDELFLYIDLHDNQCMNREELSRVVNPRDRSNPLVHRNSKDTEIMIDVFREYFQQEVNNVYSIMRKKKALAECYLAESLHAETRTPAETLFRYLDRDFEGFISYKIFKEYLDGSMAPGEDSVKIVANVMNRLHHYKYKDDIQTSILDIQSLRRLISLAASSLPSQTTDNKFNTPSKQNHESVGGGSANNHNTNQYSNVQSSGSIKRISLDSSFNRDGRGDTVYKEDSRYLYDNSIEIVTKVETKYIKPKDIDETSFNHIVKQLIESGVKGPGGLSENGKTERMEDEDNFSFSPKKDPIMTKHNRFDLNELVRAPREVSAFNNHNAEGEGSMYQSRDSMHHQILVSAKEGWQRDGSRELVEQSDMDRYEILSIIIEYLNGYRQVQYRRSLLFDLHRQVSIVDLFRMIEKRFFDKLFLDELEEFVSVVSRNRETVYSVDLLNMFRLYDEDRDTALDMKEFFKMMVFEDSPKNSLAHSGLQGIGDLSETTRETVYGVVYQLVMLEKKFIDNRKACKNKIFTMFNILDRQEKGFVSIDDVVFLLKSFNANIDNLEDVKAVIERFDRDKDGVISFNEFLDVMSED